MPCRRTADRGPLVLLTIGSRALGRDDAVIAFRVVPCAHDRDHDVGPPRWVSTMSGCPIAEKRAASSDVDDNWAANRRPGRATSYERFPVNTSNPEAAASCRSRAVTVWHVAALSGDVWCASSWSPTASTGPYFSGRLRGRARRPGSRWPDGYRGVTPPHIAGSRAAMRGRQAPSR